MMEAKPSEVTGVCSTQEECQSYELQRYTEVSQNAGLLHVQQAPGTLFDRGWRMAAYSAT